MCISVAPADFGKTITGLYEAEDGSHVIFYQNVVGGKTAIKKQPAPTGGRRSGRKATAAKESKAALPKNWQVASNEAKGNALVIPLMTGDFDSIELLRATADTPNLLKDVKEAIRPIRRSRGAKSRSSGSSGGTVVIEQFDIYTLVRAENASDIPNAVKAVDARKRPPLNQELFDALEKWYGCPFAVACFNNDDDSGESKPIAYKYSPLHPDVFMIYTLDGHDGSVPDLNGAVDLDHVIFAGSYLQETGTKVTYRDQIPDELKDYVPDYVVGQVIAEGTRFVNGDILVPVESVRNGLFEAYRVLPPNASPSRDPISLDEASV